jgi:hypothetical protein
MGIWELICLACAYNDSKNIGFWFAVWIGGYVVGFLALIGLLALMH